MPKSYRLAALFGLLFSFLMLTSSMAQDATIVRRAAFDIGSAAIKCTIADVDIASGHIVKIVDDFSEKVDFAEDLARSYDGNLSREIMAKGLDTLKEFKRKAFDLRAVEFSAVGGATLNEARNGRAYFAAIKNETGISSRVISKQQASLLSFHSVGQVRDIPANELLVWDIGGGSMEMTARNQDGSLTFHIDNMASVSFKNVVISVIQEQDINTVSSPNPMTDNQVQRALEYVQTYAQLNVPPALAKRIKRGSMNVFGIGGVHYYSIPELLGTRAASYTREEVKLALKKWTNKPDSAFNSEYADTRLTNLILVLGYLNALDIDTVSPLKVNQTEGLLVAPEFW